MSKGADEWVGPDRWISRTLNIGDELQDPMLIMMKKQKSKINSLVNVNMST